MLHATSAGLSQLQQMVTYATDLEFEIDRLRRRDLFLQQELHEFLGRVANLSQTTAASPDAATALGAIADDCRQFHEMVHDVAEQPPVNPAFDQVVPIAVRPLVAQIFRCQQRLTGATKAVLRLDLQRESIDWFPARFRHILESLISNALRFRDEDKGEIRVGVGLRLTAEGYELRFADNGLGIPELQLDGMMELFYRAAPTRAAGLGVGLAVVKLMVEQCCGTFAIESGEGQGTSVTVILPVYSLADHVG